MPVIRRADRRRTTTPNAVMTTCASPSQGSAALAMWRVEMTPAASGPDHCFDAEQVWTVLAGSATIELDTEKFTVSAEDTVVMPAGVSRRVHADAGFTAIVVAPAGAKAAAAGGDPVLPAWIA